MFSYQYAPLIITAIILLIILSIVLAYIKTKESKERITQDFIEKLKVVSGEEYVPPTFSANKNGNLIEKWNYYWGSKLKYAGLVDDKYTEHQIGSIIAFGLFVAYAVMTLLFQNYGIGLVPIASFIMFAQQFINMKIDAREKIFDEQIPAFLSILKSNIQANETPERALINAIENIDDPLFSELKIAKSLTETGSFQSALSTLRRRTNNETLKFLTGCIELSSAVGANLEEQIEIIEEMLESKTRLKRKLQVAVSENTPLLLVSAFLIPGLFLFTYLSNQQMRDFWFKNLTSWIVFFLICIIYGSGVILADKMIKKTAKF